MLGPASRRQAHPEPPIDYGIPDAPSWHLDDVRVALEQRRESQPCVYLGRNEAVGVRLTFGRGWRPEGPPDRDLAYAGGDADAN